MSESHASLAPSGWVRRWSHLVPPGAAVLDVAAGDGRHARLFAERGCPVVAIDRDAAALRALESVAGVTVRVADLEGAAWPLPEESFDAVVVTNYLHRPLFPRLAASLRAGGVLVYETFMQGNEACGRPSNPAFLLAPGELLTAFAGALSVIAFEQGRVEVPKPAVIQRLCAVNGSARGFRLDR